MIRTSAVCASLALFMAGASGCSESNIDRDGDFNNLGGQDDSDGGGAGEDPNDDGDDPETEDDFLALAPSETDIYVFIANPARNTVTRIDVFTMDVRTIGVGVDPSIVQVTPEYDHAAVFNRGDDSVTIVNSESLDTLNVPVRDNYNAMRMSGDGAWVGLFHSQAAERPDDPPTDGLQSFNEVSFVSIPDGEHHPMAVSFNPRDIQFSEDGTLAVVVADEALWLVDLTQQTLLPRRVSVGDELDPPKAEEVVLTRSGQYAYVRQFGANDLLLVDLGTGGTQRLPVGENPTDLDLSPDGVSAVVVSRTSGEVWVFEAEQPELPPKVVTLPPELRAGSLLFDPSGSQGVLYTTSTATTTYAIWDTQTDALVVHDLVKPVSAMAVTPNGESLLVLHSQANAPDMEPTDPFFDAWAMSLISLDATNYRENPIKLPAEPIGFSNSADGRHGYFIMDEQPSMVQIDYLTLLYDEIPLRSAPVYVGVLPDIDPEDDMTPPAWASQEHPLGRISFYYEQQQRLETITGFELNGRIEE
ncbi:MAG: YncE family protein [Myxococcota bacterium]